MNTTILLDRRRMSEHAPEHHVPWLVGILESLPRPNKLETLWIFVGFYGIDAGKIDGRPWQTMDQLLSNESAFPFLKQVRVDVARRPDSTTVLHAFYERTRSFLANLSSSRKLDIRKRRCKSLLLPKHCCNSHVVDRGRCPGWGRIFAPVLRLARSPGFGGLFDTRVCWFS